MRTGATKRNREQCGDGEACKFTADIDQRAYAYLLGQYLGDGCISRIGSGFRLRLACCNAYPGIIAECTDAIRSVVRGARVGRNAKQGCTEVYSTWFHWPCLFPQHGPGLKHNRPIRLAPWQREIAIDRWPDQLLRGLIHSDGCRCLNRVMVRGRHYEYVRYLFSNESADIRDLFVEACSRLGIASRPNKRNSISVAKRDSVQQLEVIVGPKT